MMVTHTRLQQYKHHYGMVSLTGLFGCRWHRYQQSTEKTEKIDLMWFAFLILTSAFILLWFYFWLIAENNFDDIEWYAYQYIQSYVPVYTILLILTCISMAYIAILIILALCHIGHGHQIYLHHIHKVILVLVMVGCIVMSVAITDLWRSGWHLQLRSLMITAPFLHVVAVAVLTFLSWFIASNSLELESKVCKVICLGVFFALLLALYIAPLFISSPCIGPPEDLPAKPHIVAHRGASAIAPENTYIAFRKAADFGVATFETDLLISLDGVPFLLHDTTLRRTTNVDDVFPDRAYEPASMFNITDLKKLDAGSKFLENGPRAAIKDLTKAQKAEYRNQTIMTLSELLKLANATDTNILFDIKFMDDLNDGEVTDHPYNETYGDVIIQTILDSGFDQSKIWWLFGDRFNTTHNFTHYLGAGSIPTEPDWYDGLTGVNIEYKLASWDNVEILKRYNLSTNVYVINSPWLYSLYWCMGINSLTSNHAELWPSVDSPVWQLSTKDFQIMWILTDCLSLVIIVIVFIIQGLRRNKRFKEEALSIQSARQRYTQSRQKQNMKVKLIHAAEGMTEDVDRGVAAMNPDSEQGGIPTSAAGSYHSVTMAGDAGSSMSGDSLSVGNVMSNHRLSGISSPGGSSCNIALSPPPSSHPSGAGVGSSSSSGSHRSALTEDEDRGIKLAEITVDA